MSKTLAVVLMISGISMLIWAGFWYSEQRNLIDAGPVKVSVRSEKKVNWPPFLGAALLIAGAVSYPRTKKK